jgi:hypothetical protein
VLVARGVAFIKSHALSYLVGLVEEHHIDAPHELRKWTEGQIETAEQPQDPQQTDADQP